MSAPWTQTDIVRTFTAALSPAARTHLTLDARTIPLIRAACGHHSPADAARAISAGIGYRTPANAAALVLWRLRKLAREDEKEGANN